MCFVQKQFPFKICVIEKTNRTCRNAAKVQSLYMLDQAVLSETGETSGSVYNHRVPCFVVSCVLTSGCCCFYPIARCANLLVLEGFFVLTFSVKSLYYEDNKLHM